MKQSIINNKKNYFKFMKVDDFFKADIDWRTIKSLSDYCWNPIEKTLVLNLLADDGAKHVMLLQIASQSILRFRFSPNKSDADEYIKTNTRSIILDNFNDLVKKIGSDLPSYAIYVQEKITTGKIVEVSFGTKSGVTMAIQIMYEPFTIKVVKSSNAGRRQTDVIFLPENSIKYAATDNFNDYAIIQTINKPPTAKYVGFGEQGGLELVKNSARTTYFNYDNMRYRQVYNRGPLEAREPLYHSDPFFIEVNGNNRSNSAYGLFVDNPSEVFMDIGYYNSTQCRFGTRYGDLDYYCMIGDSCPDIIKSFSDIIGTARLIPRYALGYHQGCYGYESRQDIEDVVNNYRKYNIPLDGIHIDVDVQKNYKTFTIDETKFNNPKEMFENLKKQGIKCSTNITPIISNKDTDDYQTYKEAIEGNYFVTDIRYDPENPDSKIYHKYAGGSECEVKFVDEENNFNSQKPFIGEVYYGKDDRGVELGTTGHYPDLSRYEVRRWWGKQYQNIFDAGLEMVWQDMTTPCLRDSRGDMLSFPARLMVKNDYIKREQKSKQHELTPVIRIWNLYSYNLHKATYHGLNNLRGRKNKRNFIIGRGCFTGMQRFAALWTGDNSSSWEFLKINISQVLALGLTGQALSGQDIGGFEQDQNWEKWADPELLIRWTAMGAFLPWFRNHYVRKGRKLFQEPYEYKAHVNEVSDDVKYLYRSALPICKYYIELRYTLLQLFYDAMFENTLNGMPICRAMFLTDPDDKALFNDKVRFLDNQFLVRNDLLVAPIVEKQAYENGYGKRDIYLPLGNAWYQFMNNKKPLLSEIPGGSIVSEYDASINEDAGHIPFILPMYVREGAIIPTIELEQYVGQLNAQGKENPITLNIYPGLKGSYTMYLDDGVSRSSTPRWKIRSDADEQYKGEYRQLDIDHRYVSQYNRKINIKRTHDNYTPREKYFIIAILHAPAEEINSIDSIKINQTQIQSQTGSLEDLKAIDANGWLYSRYNNITYIKVLDNASELIIELRYKGGEINYFAKGDGSPENPYEIATAEHLNYLSELINSNYDIYANAHYKLTANITTDNLFNPIGSLEKPFIGTLDGGVYKEEKLVGVNAIKLDISGNLQNAGLFAVIGNNSEPQPVVKNLALSGKIINKKGSVGVLAGRLNGGIVENIKILKDTVIQGGECTGGIIGHNSGTIRKCISYANVQGTKDAVGGTGGIAGYNAARIELCINVGDVKGRGVTGGIAGTSYQSAYSNTYVNNNLNAGNVASSKSELVGGIVASSHATANGNCNIQTSRMFASNAGASSNNYNIIINYSIGTNAEYKTPEEFENGQVTKLLNKDANLWKQGTLEDLKNPYIESYPVLK